VRLWDVASGKELDEQPGHWFDPEVMALVPDGKMMAVATHAGKFEFQSVATGEVQKEIRMPRGRAMALTFGPAGQLFSGTPDATVLVWDKTAAKPPERR
jgi:hypothetical protein